MNALPSQLALVAGAAAAVALNALWEDALLVFCVWLLLRAWPGLNAATRYAVWTATLVAAVIVPLATTLPFAGASASTVHTSSGRSTALASARSAHDDKAVADRATVPPQTEGAASASLPPDAAASLPPAALPERLRLTLPLPVAMTLLIAWTLFALVSHARLATALLKLESLKRDALPLPVDYREAMIGWNAANKGARDVRLCVSDDIDVPVAVGLFDSMILIPGTLLERLSPSEIDQICLHELAHLRRADDWSNGLQRIALALFAWNPAALFVGRQLDLEREVACDDWVLSSTKLVRPYAMCLTKMAETATWPYRPMAAPGVFASRKHLSLRVERLLAAGRNAATTLSPGPATAAVAVVAALSVAMLLVAPSVAASVSVPSVQALKPAPHEARAAHAAQPAVRTLVERHVVVAPQTVAQVTPQPKAYATAFPAASPKTVHVNGTHVHLPARIIKVPAVDVDVPAMDVKVPTAPVVVPNLNQTIENSVKAATAAAMAATSSAGVMRLAQANQARACNGCNFSGVNWAGRDLRDAAYIGVDFSGAKLSRANFAGGRFNGVDFRNADLSGVNFSGAKLTGVDFSGGNLSGADFDGAVLVGCDLTGVDLSRVDLSKAKIVGSDLPGQRGP